MHVINNPPLANLPTAGTLYTLFRRVGDEKTYPCQR